MIRSLARSTAPLLAAAVLITTVLVARQPATPPIERCAVYTATDDGGMVFRGDGGHVVTEPLTLPAGNAVAAWSWGPDDGLAVAFAFSLYSFPGDDWIPGDSAELVGSGTAVLAIPAAGTYVLEVTSPGPWEIVVRWE